MDPSIFSLSFSNDTSSDSDNLIKLEKEEWSSYIGKVTKSQFVKYLRSLLYGDGDDYEELDCGLTGNDLILFVYAFPAYADLNYTLYTSYGLLSEASREIYEEEEIINISLAKTASTSYFVDTVISLEWIDDVYDSNGEIVTPPNYTIDSSDISLDSSVYGSFKIKYTVVRDTYVLNISPRDEAEQDLFGAVVYAVYSNGLNYLEIDQPDNLDEIATGEYACGWSTQGSITGQDDDPYDSPSNHNAHRMTRIDYCSGEIQSDDIYGY